MDVPQNLRNPEFLEVWGRWIPFRQKIKGCKDWVALFGEQLKWLGTFPEPTARAILEQSIRNGWQGLFEIKGGTQGKPPPINIRNQGITEDAVQKGKNIAAALAAQAQRRAEK